MTTELWMRIDIRGACIATEIPGAMDQPSA